MGWLIVALVAFGLAFSAAADDPIPSTGQPPAATAPAPTLGPCKPHSDKGVKGTLRAVPVEPEDKC